MYDATKKRGFKAIPKDLMTIAQNLIADDKVCKALYYTDEEPYTKPALTTEEKLKLLEEEYITIKPNVRLKEDNLVKNYININFDNYMPSGNPEYLTGLITIDIFCHIDNWEIKSPSKEFAFRPYDLADAVYNQIEGKKFSGIGVANFLLGEQVLLGTDIDYSGITLKFEVKNRS